MGDNSGQDIHSIKKAMTLDLDSGASRSKRLKNQFSNSPVLSSPDLNRFTLASPEVEQFIKGGIQVPSASQATPMSVYLCPKNVTDSQAQFAKGFEDVLAKYHQQRSSISNQCEEPSTVNTTTTTTLTNLTAANLHSLNVQMGTATSQASTMSSDGIGSDTSDSMTVKDEQTVPPSLDGMPIDMRDQEKLKIERKRLRNRIAASKCRKKKLERISQLEDQVNKLKTDNQEYEKLIHMLRNEVTALQQEASVHRQNGCHVEL